MKMGNSCKDTDILNIIMEFASDGIFIVDKNSIIVGMTKAYERMSGIKREEIIGLPVATLLNMGLSKVPVLEIIEEKKPLSDIITYSRTNKEILVTGIPILDEKGDLNYVVLCFRDLSELNALQKEISNSQKLIQQYKNELDVLKQDAPHSDIIARNPKMKRVLELARRSAGVDSTVLILGESGVGKDLIARYIHQHSDRSIKGKYIKIDCSSIPETLLESELFGYEKGAFTGARETGKQGLFQMAEKGTLFLDEIGDLPIQLQMKLLNTLQDRKINPLGSLKSIDVDVRVLAATNKDLRALVESGSFRSDLFYRLNVIQIDIPPLRERKEEIIPLVFHFAKKICLKYGIEKDFSSEVLRLFENYEWPGNIRELINVVERSIVLSTNNTIQLQDIMELSPIFAKKTHPPLSARKNKALKEALDQAERNLILDTLNEKKSLKLAAEELKIDISTLVRKKRKYKIKFDGSFD